MQYRILIACGLWLLTPLLLLSEAEWVRLWPSVVAIASVFLLRKAILGLLAGATAGMMLLEQGNPFAVFVSFFRDHLLPSLQSSWNLSILLFTLILGGFVSVVSRGGGIEAALRRWTARKQRGRRSILGATYGLGLVCFFDGLANSLLVGKTMLEPATRLGVSREKLAYVVDSTSSAVACVAIMSTWIAYQLSMIREGIHAAGFEVSEGKSFTLFLSSIPYNFYCWFTLLLLALVIWRDWNIGPMCKAEQIAQSRQERSDEKTGNGSTPPPSNLAAAAVPLVVLLGGLFVGLYWDGTAGQVFPLSPGRVAEAFGKADAALVMLCASTLAALVAAGMNHRSIRESGASTSGVFMEGVQQLLSPVLILVSAWIFSSTLKQLGTVSVLTTLLDGTLPLWALPFLVFLLGAAISFTTGTSWGTMGVLMPLALPVAIQLSGGVDGMVVLGVIAAVFSGAVFGDHCSPLSDTTIVASISCAVEPMEHVRTQLPYALIAAGLTIVAGFLPTGLGIHPVLALGAGFLCLLLITRFCRTAKVTL